MKYPTILCVLSAFILLFSSCGSLPFTIIKKTDHHKVANKVDDDLIKQDIPMSTYVMSLAENSDISGYVLDATEQDTSKQGFYGYKVLDSSSFLPHGDSLREAILNKGFINSGSSKLCGFSPLLGFKFKANTTGQIFYLLMDFNCHVGKFYDAQSNLIEVRDFDKIKQQLTVFAEDSFGQSFTDRQNNNFLPKKTLKN